ncbi:hypothetical protein BCL90_5172 [Pedobacter alluvionis]|uniref:Uncharacterized protein n=1 Tax=Pedobacter alluvionis TaxID=475253 RepID=A0A497XNK8_9SPHI|nr:hypothetical protein BCL90_5172 [Pedobacter alluvionis]
MVFGSQTHNLTLVFIVLEMILLIWQLARYFYRPGDPHRGWYILLLSLLLLHNITAAFFPDPKRTLPVLLQNGRLWNGVCHGLYFPFYFHKELELVEIRRHVLIWAFICISALPDLLCDYIFHIREPGFSYQLRLYSSGCCLI